MRYLSIDLEATGLKEDCLIIEVGMVPFDTETRTIAEELAYGHLVTCPSFESLKPSLDPWVIDHNRKLIERAHKDGKSLTEFKEKLTAYLESSSVKRYFNQQKIVIFGKSLNAIDLPFLNRDLGWDWMRKYFHHRVMDLSSHTLGLVDMGHLPPGSDSGSQLMKYLNMGEVSHTAMEDARNTALMYLKLLEKFKVKKQDY
jgi:oligoribonuclease (3'-5' exoribonuclease)